MFAVPIVGSARTAKIALPVANSRAAERKPAVPVEGQRPTSIFATSNQSGASRAHFYSPMLSLAVDYWAQSKRRLRLPSTP